MPRARSWIDRTGHRPCDRCAPTPKGAHKSLVANRPCLLILLARTEGREDSRVTLQLCGSRRRRPCCPWRGRWCAVGRLLAFSNNKRVHRLETMAGRNHEEWSLESPNGRCASDRRGNVAGHDPVRWDRRRRRELEPAAAVEVVRCRRRPTCIRGCRWCSSAGRGRRAVRRAAGPVRRYRSHWAAPASQQHQTTRSAAAFCQKSAATPMVWLLI